uniref:Sulfotransferase domain-containing protein n=2 Tax=Octactis speculum TaxID=3111310 RepID=A0A7S2BBP2_9STRA|mmetsp:Transcript_21487/g.29223  ORF Transcript_21487/g.29223 Transcript_21487/m.29223 type:complete len:297 (+) Transcript_21487:86-976(+)
MPRSLRHPDQACPSTSNCLSPRRSKMCNEPAGTPVTAPSRRVLPTSLGDEPVYYKKELHYFMSQNLPYDIADYNRHWYPCMSHPRPIHFMEATPNYFDEESLVGMRAAYGHSHFRQLKFLLLVANPTKRVESYWNHGKLNNWGNELGTLWNETLESAMNTCMAKEPCAEPLGDALRRGHYINQLLPWLELAPANNFMVLTKNELLQNTASTLAYVMQFLGLPSKALGRLKSANRHSHLEQLLPGQSDYLDSVFQPSTCALLRTLEKHKIRAWAGMRRYNEDWIPVRTSCLLLNGPP